MCARLCFAALLCGPFTKFSPFAAPFHLRLPLGALRRLRWLNLRLSRAAAAAPPHFVFAVFYASAPRLRLRTRLAVEFGSTSFLSLSLSLAFTPAATVTRELWMLANPARTKGPVAVPGRLREGAFVLLCVFVARDARRERRALTTRRVSAEDGWLLAAPRGSSSSVCALWPGGYVERPTALMVGGGRRCGLCESFDIAVAKDASSAGLLADDSREVLTLQRPC